MKRYNRQSKEKHRDERVRRLLKKQRQQEQERKL